MADTLIGVEAHRLLSGQMRRALRVLARDRRHTVATATLRDLEHAQLITLRHGVVALTRAGVTIALALEADDG